MAENLRDILNKYGMQVPDEKVYIKTDEAKSKIIYYGLEFVDNFQWLPEYDNVVEWLTDNKGLGLFLYGGCGRGKTVLAKYILPTLLLKEHGKVLRYYDIQECKTKFDEIKEKKLISLDDVGTEEIIMNYGNKLEPFSEIMDLVEKKSKLIVVTSNLTYEQLVERYGIRVIDRIKSTTKRILFKGESLR